VRLTDYQARCAAAIDLRANSAVNVKTTYSRVAPSPSFVPGWHYHNGPVIVTVTVGTFTFFDSKCGTFDLSAGHTYIESPGQVLNAKALPEKNAGIATVEFFTTRLYPDGALDPVPVVSAPCTP
jgi:quercetin dioxygenase-like cupin family protein